MKWILVVSMTMNTSVWATDPPPAPQEFKTQEECLDRAWEMASKDGSVGTWSYPMGSLKYKRFVYAKDLETDMKIVNLTCSGRPDTIWEHIK